MEMVAMEIQDLNDDQLLLWVDIIRRLINVDNVVSFDEMKRVRALIAEIGRERWHALAERSKHDFPVIDDLLSAFRDEPNIEVKAFLLERAHDLAALNAVGGPQLALVERLDDAART